MQGYEKLHKAAWHTGKSAVVSYVLCPKVKLLLFSVRIIWYNLHFWQEVNNFNIDICFCTFVQANKTVPYVIRCSDKLGTVSRNPTPLYKYSSQFQILLHSGLFVLLLWLLWFRVCLWLRVAVLVFFKPIHVIVLNETAVLGRVVGAAVPTFHPQNVERCRAVGLAVITYYPNSCVSVLNGHWWLGNLLVNLLPVVLHLQSRVHT